MNPLIRRAISYVATLLVGVALGLLFYTRPAKPQDAPATVPPQLMGEVIVHRPQPNGIKWTNRLLPFSIHRETERTQLMPAPEDGNKTWIITFDGGQTRVFYEQQD